MRTERLRQPPSGPFEDVEIPENSDDIANVSGVAGATVTAALDALNASGVDFSRTQDVLRVDPATVVPLADQNGSYLRPFADLQDAFDFAAVNAPPSVGFWLFDCAPGLYPGPYTIDTTVSAAIEVRCDALQGAVIQGDITWTLTSGDFLQFTNCVLSDTGGGAFVASLAAGGASLVLLHSSNARALLDLEGGAAGAISVYVEGLFSTGGSFSNCKSIATKGLMFVESAHLSGAFTALSVEVNNVGYEPGVTWTITGAGIQQYYQAFDSSAPVSVTFATPLGSFVYYDDKSKYLWDAAGTTTNAATETLMAPTAAPLGISNAINSAGIANTLARSDHIHAHGDRGGGTLHAEAVSGGAAGFMSGADKALLDGITDSVDPAVSGQHSGLEIGLVLFVAGVDDTPFQLPYKWRFVDFLMLTTTAGAGGSTAQWRTEAAGAGVTLSTTLSTASTTALARNNGGGNVLPNQTVNANTDVFLKRTDVASAGTGYVYAMRVD